GAAIPCLDVRNKFFEDFAGVADESGIHLHVLVDFGAVNLNVDLACALGVGAKVAGDAVVEAHAHGNEQVGFLNGIVHPSFTVHAHHSQVERIFGRAASDAE